MHWKKEVCADHESAEKELTPPGRWEKPVKKAGLIYECENQSAVTKN